MTKTAALNTPQPDTLPTTVSAIKRGIQGVLSKKYGEIDTKHLFDGIDDHSALAGYRGDGIFYAPHIENVTPLENNLFKIEYHLTDDINRCDSCNTAILGLKEKQDGSRFWSVFSVDYNYTGNKFNY